MGCDIHGYVEIKKGGKWEVYKEIPDDRDYDWFGVIAGIRNDVNTKPISEPRGIPEDASDKVKKESNEQYHYHSYSYLYLDEIINHNWEYESIDGRMSTIDKATGEELGKASYDANWGSQLDKYDYVNMKRKARDLRNRNWDILIEELKRKCNGPSRYKKIRFVFWFDN